MLTKKYYLIILLNKKILFNIKKILKIYVLLLGKTYHDTYCKKMKILYTAVTAVIIVVQKTNKFKITIR